MLKALRDLSFGQASLLVAALQPLDISVARDCLTGLTLAFALLALLAWLSLTCVALLALLAYLLLYLLRLLCLLCLLAWLTHSVSHIVSPHMQNIHRLSIPCTLHCFSMFTRGPG